VNQGLVLVITLGAACATYSSAGAQSCDPSYPDVCIPPPPPDLDCADVSASDFIVVNKKIGYRTINVRAETLPPTPVQVSLQRLDAA
jgi:hypothetical protein